MTKVSNPKVDIQLLGQSGATKSSLFVPPVEQSVFNYFDDSYWESSSDEEEDSGNGEWTDDSGGQWFTPSTTLQFMELVPITSGENSGWQSGFRPSQLLLTVVVDNIVGVTEIDVGLLGESGTIGFSTLDVSTNSTFEVTIPLDFSTSGNIQTLFMEFVDGTSALVAFTRIQFVP